MKAEYFKNTSIIVFLLALTISGFQAQAKILHKARDGFNRYESAITSDAGLTERISVASDRTQGNGYSYSPSISGDGRYVAFSSEANNLVSGDENENDDIFLHDRQTGLTKLVSVASDGTQGISRSDQSSISSDGHFIAFVSWASNLVPGDINNSNDIFVHDSQTGQTELVSVASDGTKGNSGSSGPSISADGRYIAFSSFSDNLVPGDTNIADIFVHDRQTGQTELVSMASDGTKGNSDSYGPSISADGHYVAFESHAINLVSEPDINLGLRDVFVHDRQTGLTERVSEASDGTGGNEDSGMSAISADGRFVAFWSYSSNLVIGDTNKRGDVFVHDRQTGQTERVSVASDGGQGINDSSDPAISTTGRYVGFNSLSDNLVSDDTNYVCDINDDYDYSDNCPDIFVHDRQTGNTVRVSVASDGTDGNGGSLAFSIAANGSFVSFESLANNLIDWDTNGTADTFVHNCFSYVSGKVTYGDGSPISGVLISDGTGGETITNSFGEYIFDGYSPGTYTITPTMSGYLFSPPSIEIAVPASATNVDFVGGLNISGIATYGDGSPITNATISAGGGNVTTTNSSGEYTLQYLAPGTHTLTPSKSGFSFSPPSIEITVPPNASNVDFVGGFIISGVATYGGGTPISGVTISAGSENETTTNSNGEYLLKHLPPGIYTLTPSKLGYSFDPPFRELAVPPNANDANFTGMEAILRTFIPIVIK